MTQRSIVDPISDVRKGKRSERGGGVADLRRLEQLETRVRQLEAEKSRLERERLEVQTMSDELAGCLDGDVRKALEHRFRGKRLHLELLRDGRVVSIDEVLPESVLDLAELTFWRHALAQATGLQTHFFLRDGDGLRAAGNSPAQLPSLSLCDKSCRDAVEEAVLMLPAISEPVGLTCSGCGGRIWAVPVQLSHSGAQGMIGILAGHALADPVEPQRRMVELLARMASRHASDEYSQQLNMALEMKVATLVRNYTDTLLRSTEETREALILQEKTAVDLARAKEDLEAALDEAQRAREEAERANRTKSMFLASMSHEIRTPLTCVIGFADLLTMPAITPEEGRDFAGSIKESGQVLLSLINNVLDLSKIEAGRLELERIPYSIRDLADEIAAVFSPTAREKRVDLAVEVGPEVAPEQSGDPTRVRQILMNLVGNALKFTDTGRVAITCGADRKGWLRIAVSDSGSGIPADRLDTIFDAFSQAERGTTRKHGGTGLGLDISRKLVAAMGGEIGVESREGEGTCFTFRIPEALEALEQEPSPA